MKVLDLFSGIGGFSLGLERAGMETIAFCEFDKKAQLVLKKHWPDVPIYDDVRKLNGRQFEGQSIDLICGGFPCQPFSQAGKRKGEEDDRHLWPEYFRLIQEIRPRWVIGENVPGLINLGLDKVLSDLESEDYSCQTLVIPACAVNAPHRRDRVWIIAHSNTKRHAPKQRLGETGEAEHYGPSGTGTHTDQDVAHSQSKRLQGKRPQIYAEGREGPEEGSFGLRSGRMVSNSNSSRKASSWDAGRMGGIGEQVQNKGTYERENWESEPSVGRVAHGIPNRVDRLRQLGNAVVPQVVEQIGRAIMEIENDDSNAEGCANGTKSDD